MVERILDGHLALRLRSNNGESVSQWFLEEGESAEDLLLRALADCKLEAV